MLIIIIKSVISNSSNSNVKNKINNACTRYNNGGNIRYQLDIWHIAHDGASIEQATKKVYKDY